MIYWYFAELTKKSMHALKGILSEFNLLTGLNVNNEKSSCFLSRACGHSLDLLNILNIPQGQLPIKYLGLPLSSNYIMAKDCKNLTDKFRFLCQGWQGKKLSMAGRIQLVNSVLGGSINYWLQSFRLPKTVLKTLTAIARKFVWNHKAPSWKWVDLCQPKESGGLGIRSFSQYQLAFGIRLLWQLLKSNSLWSQWMQANYYNRTDALNYNPSPLD